jgi:hypothetical protein
MASWNMSAHRMQTMFVTSAGYESEAVRSQIDATRYLRPAAVQPRQFLKLATRL